MARQAEGLAQVLTNLNAHVDGITARCEAAMEIVVAALEGWAKSEHKYTDRTTNNTNSIRGFVAEATPQLVRGVLAAGMEYSIFLELARNGEWAFLLPVIQRHRADIIAILREQLGSGAVK